MNKRDARGLGLGCSVVVGMVCLCAIPVQARPSASAVSTPVPSGPGSLSGVWTPADFDRSVFRDPKRTAIRTIEGEPPPLRPWVAQLMAKRRLQAKEGHPYAGLQSRCIPAGMPQMMFGSGLPHETVETPGQVTMLVDELTFFRIIRLNARHAVDPKPSLMGDSVGHWAGDELIVDTVGISDQTQLPDGIPHSDQLHIIERYHRTSQDRIELLMTFEDPKAFTKPWTTVTHLQLEPTRHVDEYFCENNRNIDVGGSTTVVLPPPKHH